MLALLKKIWAAWRWLGHKIGHVNGIIILTIFYLLVFTPCAWLTRFVGADPIHGRPEPNLQSYWLVRLSRRSVDAYRQPF
jgi:hypothetical protein